jgi:DNA adenine methylase
MDQIEAVPMRWDAPLKYAGGKSGLASEILRYVPAKWKTYHEPFFGGGAIFFALREKYGDFPAFLNDSNEKLMNMYVAIRDDVENVIRHLHEHVNSSEHYYQVRMNNMDVGSKAKRAADLIFLNRCGYNGMYRVNQNGRFNVPFGNNPKALLCDEARLQFTSKQLKSTTILHHDFEYTIRHHMRMKLLTKGDLIYLDSPYMPLSKTASFTKYGADGFKLEDHQRLAKLTKELVAEGVHVILSASSAKETYELYGGLPIIDVEAKRSVNSNAKKRGAVKEALVVSPWLLEQAKEKT